MQKITVAADGSGDYCEIQSAVDVIPAESCEPVEIRIKPGVYKQKLVIEKPFVRLIGESADTTILTYDDSGYKKLPDGEAMGTFHSYSTFVGAHDFYAENITFENTAGPGKTAGQALAAYVDADRVCFKKCRFIGCQDTLFTGPLPPKEILPGGFKGPRQYAPRINGRQYYEDCYICGDVDFIFGSATAYFSRCIIHSNNLNQEVNGYVTAPSTPQGQKYGYVFSDCKFTSDCAPATVYLFRPWRNFARAVFLHCEMGAHIKPEGFYNWNKPESETTVVCGEYRSFGEGAHPGKRAAWAKQLTEEQAQDTAAMKVLSGEDGWQPWNGKERGLT